MLLVKKNKLQIEQEKFKGLKQNLMMFMKQKDQQRKQELEDQGQWKTLWEEANKTAQEKDATDNEFISTIRRFKNF